METEEILIGLSKASLESIEDVRAKVLQLKANPKNVYDFYLMLGRYPFKEESVFLDKYGFNIFKDAYNVFASQDIKQF